jgi:hypothetical protein
MTKLHFAPLTKETKAEVLSSSMRVRRNMRKMRTAFSAW